MKFSIGIPTYNRETKLRRQIESILEQNLDVIEEIIIVDNDSNYSLNELIERYNCDKIKVVRNSFNIGMAVNMSMPMLHCKTEWLWLLSDDDQISKNAIQNIYDEINKSNNSNVGCIKFSIENFNSNKDIVVSTANELIEAWGLEKKGEFIFISTTVINIKKLQNSLNIAFEYAGTYIGFILPVVSELCKKSIKIKLSKKSIVVYDAPNVSGYKYGEVAVGMSTLFDLRFDASKAVRKKLYKILISLDFKTVLINYLVDKNFVSRSDILKARNRIYREYTGIAEYLICNSIFYISRFRVVKQVLKRICLLRMEIKS